MPSKKTKEWNPIPEKFNRAWQIDVLRIEDHCIKKDTNLAGGIAITVAAYWENEIERITGAWKISFNIVNAYRQLYFNDMPLSELIRPDLNTGMWEINTSSFSHRNSQLHHYVVFSYDTVYEIIAENWSVHLLPDIWAKPFEFSIPPQLR